MFPLNSKSWALASTLRSSARIASTAYCCRSWRKARWGQSSTWASWSLFCWTLSSGRGIFPSTRRKSLRMVVRYRGNCFHSVYDLFSFFFFNFPFFFFFFFFFFFPVEKLLWIVQQWFRQWSLVTLWLTCTSANQRLRPNWHTSVGNPGVGMQMDRAVFLFVFSFFSFLPPPPPPPPPPPENNGQGAWLCADRSGSSNPRYDGLVGLGVEGTRRWLPNHITYTHKKKKKKKKRERGAFSLLHCALRGNSDQLTRVKALQPQEQRYPAFLSVSTVFSCVQTMVWMPRFGIFNVRTDADACDCTRGLYGHRKRRVRTESWLWEKEKERKKEKKNPLPHLGLEPAVSITPGFSVRSSIHWATL